MRFGSVGFGVAGALVLAMAGAPSFQGPRLSYAQGIGDPGERAFQFCFSCHSADPNEPADLQGPNLFGIVGRPVAAQNGFKYSDAMKEFGADEKVWTAELIAEFIQDPEAVVPGTAMQLPPGPRNAEQRAALLDYLARQR